MEIKEFKIKWPTDTGPAVFANNVTIQAEASGVVYMTFFQTAAPNLMGTKEEQVAQLQTVEEIEAKPIVKIVMTNDVLVKLSRIMKQFTDNENVTGSSRSST